MATIRYLVTDVDAAIPFFTELGVPPEGAMHLADRRGGYRDRIPFDKGLLGRLAELRLAGAS